MRRITTVIFSHIDVAIAALLLGLGLIEALAAADHASVPGQMLLTFVWCVPLAWRRRWPVVVLATVMLAGIVMPYVNEIGGINSFVFAAILAAYTVGRLLDPPQTWWGPVWTVGLYWTAGSASGDAVLSDYVFSALIYGGAWAVGYAIRRRATENEVLAREAEQLREEHAERERVAVEAERARIARELHDIVSHGLTAITIQSQAARRRLALDGHDEAETLGMIESTARQAMAEMRRMLGILRATDDPLTLAPQPGIDDLPRHVSDLLAHGLDVRYVVEGDPIPVEQGISLACFRIVQEALTNVRKHSASNRADVTLRYTASSLDIRVDDPGPARPARNELADRGGFGLTGMRQRVMLYDGEMSAGPLPGGGFRVEVTLPLVRREVIAT